MEKYCSNDIMHVTFLYEKSPRGQACVAFACTHARRPVYTFSCLLDFLMLQWISNYKYMY